MAEREGHIMQRVSRLVGRGLVGGSLIAFACGLSAAAQAQVTLGSLVQITQGDPFSTCTADQVKSQEKAFGSTLFSNTVIEPWAAVDPTNPTHLLVAHQQDRWSDGGSRGLTGDLSTDSGSTWSDTIPNGVTECTGGNFGRASDPWVTFALDGTAFFFSLVLDPAQFSTPFGARNSGLLVSRSTDGAKSWGAPTVLLRTKSSHVLNDKNSITADPVSTSHVYAVWDQLSVFPTNGGQDQANQLLAANDGVVIARELAGLLTAAAGGAPSFKFSFTGPTFLSTTADTGVTWSAARTIFDPGTNSQTIDNLIVVRPNGDVLDFFTVINFTGAPGILSIGHIVSTDHGATWSGPTFASDIRVAKVISPDSGQPIRDASILYSVAGDPNSNAIYLVWQDDRLDPALCTTPAGTIPVDRIAFSQSLDGGVTWSSPVRINQTPSNSTHPCREQAFIPAVVVAGDGTVVVTYYDFRNDTNTPAGFEATDYFAITCTGSCTTTSNWKETQLTTSSFNILDAPAVASGHFLGDYMGLAASGTKTVFPVFGMPVRPNETADFVREMTLP
jgi:hypothetical protein